MKLRSFPLVLRMHKFKESKNPHEFFYSELLLYKHWRSEDELREDSFDECLKLFNMSSPNDPNQTYIFEVKERLFPQKNNVELARAIIEELDDQDQRPAILVNNLMPKTNRKMKTMKLLEPLSILTINLDPTIMT